MVIDIKQYITDKETLNNVIDIYKELMKNRKENNILIQFFKFLLFACIDKSSVEGYIKPNIYFSPYIHEFSEGNFSLNTLKQKYKWWEKKKGVGRFFNKYPEVYKNKLFIIKWK
jgi:hypothetical protein